MTMGKEELKPCPFCQSGMENFAGLTPDAFARVSDGGYSINCDCGALGPTGPTMLEAIAAWNTRPAPVVDEGCAYAERLAIALHGRLWGSNQADWKPLSGDLMGLLTQIDNMIASAYFYGELADQKEAQPTLASEAKPDPAYMAANAEMHPVQSPAPEPTVDMEPVAWRYRLLDDNKKGRWHLDFEKPGYVTPTSGHGVEYEQLYSQAQVDALQAKVDQFEAFKAALEEIATNHANGATFSGTDCAEIAREALGDE